MSRFANSIPCPMWTVLCFLCSWTLPRTLLGISQMDYILPGHSPLFLSIPCPRDSSAYPKDTLFPSTSYMTAHSPGTPWDIPRTTSVPQLATWLLIVLSVPCPWDSLGYPKDTHCPSTAWPLIVLHLSLVHGTPQDIPRIPSGPQLHDCS